MSELYRPGVKGCTDGNCLLVKNTGMITNGGCQCESDIRRVPQGFDAIRTIHFLRSQLIGADAELERLRADLDLWQSELSKVMSPDFKDWHENDEAELPVVARIVIENLRCRLDSSDADLARVTAERDKAIAEVGKIGRELGKTQAANDRLLEALGKISNASLNAWSARRMQSVARAALKVGLDTTEGEG